MTGSHHCCNGHELGQTSGDGEGQRGLACCSPWGPKESDTTGRLNNNNNAEGIERNLSIVLISLPEARIGGNFRGTVTQHPGRAKERAFLCKQISLLE